MNEIIKKFNAKDFEELLQKEGAFNFGGMWRGFKSMLSPSKARQAFQESLSKIEPRQNFSGQAGGATQQFKTNAYNTFQRFGQKAKEYGQKGMQFVRQHPKTSIGVGAGLGGVAVGRMSKPTTEVNYNG